ncbi:hypothetical protein BCR33DRAFT_719722 [Rhizoclosmatium globosum]|uniref:Family A G protein-coupled receptor-like protein n=1 Tax=Rhizoclosmatium globosum TaxID=329046 RepID=A0A1Y2AZV0_9FUNG|nr:hypothetical protein BCR33DRAFT_725213 [Rhizoclosmatium globosum]ORY39898.1 hypothetical protein BCR33DRAFT_719722 [Rhizoclosmatium globosum]|eukprot:ORY28109.1 hypothetical protein BCR33DRAFT_725213 [Rhizoclosmatium globosum]
MDAVAFNSTTNIDWVTATVAFEFTLAATDAGKFLFLLWLIISIELPLRGLPCTFRHVFTVTNSLLLCLYFSMMSFFIASAISHSHHDDILFQHRAMKAVSITFGLTELSYLWFNFIRSSEVLKLYSTPKVYKVFQRILYLTPICSTTSFFLEFIPVDPIDSYKIYVFAAIIPAMLTLALDSFFTYSYLFHLFFSTSMNITAQPECKIIARYGLISTSLCFFGFCFFVLQSITFFQPVSDDGIIRLFYVSNALFDLGMWGAETTVFFMKIALVRPGMLQVNGGKQSVKNLAKGFLDGSDNLNTIAREVEK